jgi:D-cysteine desulfhydrase family pyridoxal phosphate-dependent enzyme
MISVDALVSRLNDLDPLSVGQTPTPIEHLPRISALLDGPDLWIKRDDQTGIATGGNKVRKLRFLLSEAIRTECDVVITAGAIQSNHVRQTAALASQLGLSCIAVLKGSQPLGIKQGNYLLDHILGTEVCWAEDREITEVLQETADRKNKQGHKSYIIPFGGSNALGVCGYIAGMVELIQQTESQNLNFDCMIIPTGSGGTQAGLILGAHLLGYKSRILGISVIERAATMSRRINQLVADCAGLLHFDINIPKQKVEINDLYLGNGYGVVGRLERKAIACAGQNEGLLLDPVYTARAFGAVIDLIKKRELPKEQRVLFWHTGGIPALFAYAEVLLS